MLKRKHLLKSFLVKILVQNLETKFNYTGFQEKKKLLLDSLSERLEVELKEFGKIKDLVLTDMKNKRPSEFKKY